MPPTLSVVICAHNPRQDFLQRVLNALQKQTLSVDQWELLLVDNASDQKLSEIFDLCWHPHAHHLCENTLGLTPARLRGIQNALGEVLVFVDDDNVLDPNYLELALNIHHDYSFIGVWGGQVIPEFEVAPPPWTQPYWWLLAVREFQGNRWSNFTQHNVSSPCGAGLCLRSEVAQTYATNVQQDPIRQSMGRKGNVLTASEDSDIAYTACDMGLGTGQFEDLKLRHLIGAQRLQEAYLAKLIEGMTYSEVYLGYVRGQKTRLPQRSWDQKLLDAYRLLRMSSPQRRLTVAAERGKRKAIQEIRQRQTNPLAV